MNTSFKTEFLYSVNKKLTSLEIHIGMKNYDDLFKYLKFHFFENEKSLKLERRLEYPRLSNLEK